MYEALKQDSWWESGTDRLGKSND